MLPDTMKQALADILTSLDDQGKVSNILTGLADEIGMLNTQKTAAEIRAEELQKANESLRDTNMRLFLKVGAVPEPEPQQQEEQVPSYEDLFDAKGNLK